MLGLHYEKAKINGKENTADAKPPRRISPARRPLFECAKLDGRYVCGSAPQAGSGALLTLQAQGSADQINFAEDMTCACTKQASPAWLDPASAARGPKRFFVLREPADSCFSGSTCSAAQPEKQNAWPRFVCNRYGMTS